MPGTVLITLTSDLIRSLCNSPVKVSDPWKNFVNLNVFQKGLLSKSD